jgi:hypothetical protein
MTDTTREAVRRRGCVAATGEAMGAAADVTAATTATMSTAAAMLCERGGAKRQ